MNSADFGLVPGEYGSPALLTHSGRLIPLLEIRPSDIDLNDIAWSLAHLCRFNGHVKGFYSVAQHSVLVSRHCETLEPAVQAAALLHDAAEAYTGDIISPMKAIVDNGALSQLTARIDWCIRARFGLPVSLSDAESQAVAKADYRTLQAEFRDVTLHGARLHTYSSRDAIVEPIEPLLPPEEALVQFLDYAKVVGIA